MKPAPPSRTKREEAKTYQQIGLGRPMKTRAQRARAERSGVHRVVGGQEMERPHLQASRQRYHEIRLEVTRLLLEKVRAARLRLPVAVLFQHFRPQIEQMTYDRLSAEQQQAVRLENAFLQHHGRSPTTQEKARFRESDLPPDAQSRPPAWSQRRHTLVDGLLNKLQERQTHNPARYQTVWAEVVGPEIAQQSCLEKINSAEGVAWFRCINSALSYQLQRQPELVIKLSRALKLKVKTLKVCR